MTSQGTSMVQSSNNFGGYLVTSSGNTYTVTNSTSTGNATFLTTNATGTGLIGSVGGTTITTYEDVARVVRDMKIDPDAGPMTIELPDGALLQIDANGNYKIEDKDAKVTYKSNNVREFNKFVNASDLLEQFIRDLGLVGVTQDKVLKVSIEVFINWLILKAAEHDDDEIAARGIPRLEESKNKLPQIPKCLCCGKFIRHDLAESGINFCNDKHLKKYAQKNRLSLRKT